MDLSAPTYRSNAGPNGAKTVGIGNDGEPWFSGSRWGLKGSEDLGNGTHITFRLESEFVVASGNAEDRGQIFDRDAWVGIEDPTLGKLTVGFQNTIARDASAIYGDPYGSALLTTEEGGWTKLFGNGVFLSAGYAFGNTTNFAVGSNYQVAAGYNGGPFNVSGFYSHANRGGFANQSYSVGGNYTFGIVRLNVGYFHYTGDQGALGQRRDNAWTVSMKLTPRGPLDYELGDQQMHASNAAYNDDGNVPNANTGAFGLTNGVGSGPPVASLSWPTRMASILH
jgi:predicted porin